MNGKLKEEPRLSGAIIRTLVKQLTPSRTKDPTNGQKITKLSQGLSESPPQTHQPKPPQQHKKQVRRRLHTTKPYQERLLNMAEARREIVTALKFHRASMKQANEQHQQQQLSQSSNFSSPSSTSNLDNFPHSSSFPQYYPYAPPAIPFQSTDTLDFTLPNQTLGLNLNFHGFNNIDNNLYQNSCHNPSINSSSCVTQEVPSVGIGDSPESHHHHHQAMDDEGMGEMRSLGEKHQMEWNDTMDLVTSTWWLKFLKSMELGVPELKTGDEDDDGFQPFDQIMEFPAWLKPNDTHHFNDHCPDDYFQVPALPCMDIGEIEGMDDGEWLA